jgi:MraZ protein
MSTVINEIFYSLEYRHGVDEKRRVSVPAGWRSGQEGEETVFYIFLWDKAGCYPCLMALPPAGVQDLMERVRKEKISSPEAEALRRLLGRSAKVVVDKAGRICLPDQLAKAAHLEKEVVMKGMLDRFQIWNPEYYEKVVLSDEVLKGKAIDLI